jgi:hypothetical protein
MTSRQPARRPGDRLVITGATVFGVGLLATLITVVPLFLGSSRLPVPFYLLALLAPVGLGIALTGLLRSARSGRSRARQR